MSLKRSKVIEDCSSFSLDIKSIDVEGDHPKFLHYHPAGSPEHAKSMARNRDLK